MSVNDYEGLITHIGHKLACVEYGGALNATIECKTCGTVLVSFDKDPSKCRMERFVREAATGRIFSFVGQDSENWLITRRGGGPIRTLVLAEGVEVPAPESSYQEDLAFLDAGEGVCYHPCIVDKDDRWNGWAQPLLTLDVLEEVASECILDVDLRTDGTYLVNKHADDEDEDEDETLVVEYDIDGEKRYLVNGWCWNLKSDYPDSGE